MTRIGLFEIRRCPACGQQHLRPRYASISVYVPDIPPQEELRTCAGCGKQFLMESFIEEGEVLKSDLQRKPEPPTFWQRLRAAIFGKHTLPEDEGPHPLRDLPWLR
jgi:hypothetical protein